MYMVAFLALRILYVIALVCFVFVPCSPPESLPGKDVLCRLLPRPLPSVCFLFFSFLFRPCSPQFVLVKLPLSCDHNWIRSGPVNNVR